MAKKVRVIAELAALKRGLRKKLKSSIGWLECSSHQAKAVSTAAPTRKQTTVTGSVQPLRGASMIANSTMARPMIESTAPIGSRRGAEGSFESGIRKTPATRPKMTMGRFTRKTEPQ